MFETFNWKTGWLESMNNTAIYSNNQLFYQIDHLTSGSTNFDFVFPFTTIFIAVAFMRIRSKRND